MCLSVYVYEKVEGAAFEDGKTPSIWDTFSHSGKYIFIFLYHFSLVFKCPLFSFIILMLFLGFLHLLFLKFVIKEEEAYSLHKRIIPA